MAGSDRGGLAAAPDPGGDPLPGTDYTKVRFVGVQFDALETKLTVGQEGTYLVHGRVKSVGEEEMADGHKRRFAKIKVDSVIEHDDA